MARIDRVVLCGTNGAGKTDISRAWAHLLNGVPLSFADPIRSEAAYGLAINEFHATDVFEIKNRIEDLVYKMQDPETKDEYRGLLQEIGKLRTRQDPEYWLKRFKNRFEPLRLTNTPLSCGDCRLDNQMELLKEWGFTFVRLEDGPYVRDQGDRQNDETEHYWPNWEYDFVLDFQEGIEHQARRLVEEFGLNGNATRN